MSLSMSPSLVHVNHARYRPECRIPKNLSLRIRSKSPRSHCRNVVKIKRGDEKTLPGGLQHAHCDQTSEQVFWPTPAGQLPDFLLLRYHVGSWSVSCLGFDHTAQVAQVYVHQVGKAILGCPYFLERFDFQALSVAQNGRTCFFVSMTPVFNQLDSINPSKEHQLQWLDWCINWSPLDGSPELRFRAPASTSKAKPPL